MADEREALRDWHRLFGLLLIDFFTGSPFVVEVERDLSVQQQLLDVAIVRRGRGRLAVRPPDGLEHLRPHNLLTFKSHREALTALAMKELIGFEVAYHKLVSPSPSELLPDDQFGLYGSGAYQRHSAQTSRLLGQLFERFHEEGFAMSFTMEDFNRQYIKAAYAGRASGGVAKVADGATPGRSFRRADPAIPRSADRRAPRHAAQAAPEEVTRRRVFTLDAIDGGK
jgi:hypothetical protein